MAGKNFICNINDSDRKRAGQCFFCLQRIGQEDDVAVVSWWFLSGAFGVGALTYGWGSSYAFPGRPVPWGQRQPLFWGNLVMMSLGTGILVFLYRKRYKKNRQKLKETSMKERLRSSGFSRISGKEKFFFGILLVFITWIMFYVFYVYKDTLYMGYTVYGDYAPHTAMMRSFSRGNNFPTEYPHFGGQDVKYHFMFQFLTGNLEYLGLRIDLAYNLLSILALWGFLVLLYLLAVRVTDSRKAGTAGNFSVLFQKWYCFFPVLVGTYSCRRSYRDTESKYIFYRLHHQRKLGTLEF